MVKFVNNNAMNASTSQRVFKLNCNYFFYIFFEGNTNPCSELIIAKKLSSKLRKLMLVF